MTKKFLRSDTPRHLKLGKRRRKLQKWRKPRGRHNKIRKKRFSYPSSPVIGYKKPRNKSFLVNNKIPLVVNNLKELERAHKNNIVIISSKVGAKKRLDLIKKSQELGLNLHLKEKKHGA